MLHSCAAGINAPDNSREEEGDGEDCDVIEHENAGRGNSNGVCEAALQLCAINLIEQNGLGQALRLDAIDSKFLLFFREPAGGVGPVSESEKGYE